MVVVVVMSVLCGGCGSVSERTVLCGCYLVDEREIRRK